jgi:Xaa-Pro aminopeptidase
MQSRLGKIKSALAEKNLDALIVTNPTNIFYLTGFRGVSPTEREATVIIFKSKPTILITAKLYQNEALALSSNHLKIAITEERAHYQKALKENLSASNKIGLEEHHLTLAEYIKLKKLLKGKKLTPVGDLVETLRKIKTSEEITNIEGAQKLTQDVFGEILKTIKVGQTEAEIKDNLEKIAKSKNREQLAFDPIVASGPNSALPHYATGARKIKKGDALLFDFGLKYNNYCADFSRTIFIESATDEQKNIYSLVAIAQKTAIAKIKTNSKAKDVFRESFSLFKKNGLQDKFIHSLGHGIGLEVHEQPSLYKTSKDILKPCMVFSVEPGLYLPWGGVRIEDLVTIKKGRGEIIGKAGKFIEIT